MSDDKITIDKKDYEALMINHIMLKSIEEAGIKDWDQIKKAKDIFKSKIQTLIQDKKA